MKFLPKFSIAAAALATVSTGAVAAGTMDLHLYESGSDVVFTFSGSVDLTGLFAYSGSNLDYVGLFPEVAFIASYNGSYYNYGLRTNTFPGFGDFVYREFDDPAASSTAGSTFGFNQSYLQISTDYVSNSLLAGQAVVFGTDLAGMGVYEGFYTGTYGANVLNMTVGEITSEVPLPASALLLLTGLGALSLRRRKV
ncbi:VPLPA-CTERM sorting domain-containing protein [Primorskyibacter sp. 2E107]|uniref:VPLPA-CTERM sorting domain-containing protein n=1 Tax=Primorskyibacter sp. 2E107 TaxID=3403458 RepID=UPI003AF828BE